MKRVYSAVLAVFTILIAFISFSPRTFAATEISGPSVIHKAADQILTVDTILGLYQSEEQLQAVDDTYTGNGNVVGSYDLLLSDGTVTKSVEILVVEGWLYGTLELDTPSDIICVSDYKNVHVKSSRALTPGEIVQYILTSTGYVTIDAQTGMSVLVDTYSNNASEPGLYQMQFRLVSTSGFDATYTITIYVSDGMDLWSAGFVFDAPPTPTEVFLSYFIPGLFVVAILVVLYKYLKRKKVL